MCDPRHCGPPHQLYHSRSDKRDSKARRPQGTRTPARFIASLADSASGRDQCRTIAEQAVVIGAGMGGLAGAKAVAPYFEQVTVLDRDVLPEARRRAPARRRRATCIPARSGEPEGARGAVPRLRRRLERAGAVSRGSATTSSLKGPATIRFPVRDLGFETFSLSRPLIESVCRRRLMEELNVDLRPRTRVSGSFPPRIAARSRRRSL